MLKPQEHIIRLTKLLNLHRPKPKSAQPVAQICMVHWCCGADLNNNTAGEIDTHPESGIEGKRN